MTIWVGRYAIVDGAVREHGPAFIDRVRTREEEAVRLLILADPADARSAEFCPEVADAISELFSRESLSVTGGLLRALRQAHANLAEWNRRSLREHAVAVGITCVAIRDGEVTIAQVGPGIVYTSGPEGFQRLAAEGDAAQPLGGTEPIAPQFHQVRIEGRLLLLLTTSVERAIGESAITSALGIGPERALAELFTRTRNIPDMTAALIADLDVPEEALAAAAAEQAPKVPTGVGRSGRDAWEGVPPARPVDSGRDFIAAARRRFALPSLRRERSTYAAPSSPPGALSRVGARRAAPGPGLPRLTQWRAAALVAVAVVAMIALAWCTLPGFLQQDRTSQIDDAINSAQSHITAAQQPGSDVPHSRTELDAARNDVARARGIKPDDPRVATTQAQIDQIAKALDAVVDLGDGLKRVIAFDGTITAPFNMTMIAFGDSAVWLVDSQRARVFRVDPSGKTEPQEVYRTGANYGGTTARDPKAIAWDASGQRLLLVDAGPSLFSIATGKAPVAITMRGAKDLKSITAIAAYTGNLYVLDTQAGEIWRYLPGGDGFDSERSGLLGGVDLGDAKALAVDGDFYVLGSSSARHFRPPRELPPLLQGVDRPISSATGIAGDTQRQLFYLADRGGRRIVVSDRDGAYRRQYRHPNFADVRGVTLSGDGTAAYVLTGDGLYSFAPSP